MLQISVIIPVLNEGSRVASTVEFLRQEGGHLVSEIIVADGGSSDDTVARAGGAGAIVLHCPQKGRNFQMNFAAQNSTGNVLYFVHADTRPPRRYAHFIEEALAKGVKIGNFRYCFDSDHFLLRINSWFTRWRFLFCQGGDKTLFVERALFQHLGGYAPEWIIMEEYDLLRRAEKAGFPFQVLKPEALVSARKYDHNSWLRVQMANLIVFNLWAWKLASPAALKRIYSRLLNERFF